MGVPSSSEQSHVVQPEAAQQTTVPDLAGMTPGDAGKQAEKAGFTVVTLGSGSSVLKQYPAAGTLTAPSQRIYIVTQEPGDDVPVPSLKGKSLRDAMEICSLLQISCHASGEGYVADQTLSAGSGARVLELRLLPADQLAAADKTAKADDSRDQARGKASPGTGSTQAKKQQDPSG
jgi:penicillin-binding protein 2B